MTKRSTYVFLKYQVKIKSEYRIIFYGKFKLLKNVCIKIQSCYSYSCLLVICHQVYWSIKLAPSLMVPWKFPVFFLNNKMAKNRAKLELLHKTNFQERSIILFLFNVHNFKTCYHYMSRVSTIIFFDSQVVKWNQLG